MLDAIIGYVIQSTRTLRYRRDGQGDSMFGAAQVATVGYITDGAIYCRECAEKMEEQGTNIHGADWSDLIQYSADEWAAENAYERAREGDYEIEEYDYPTCDGCGKAVGA